MRKGIGTSSGAIVKWNGVPAATKVGGRVTQLDRLNSDEVPVVEAALRL